MITDTIPLNDGRAMPRFGLGTFLMPPGETEALVRTAIEIGYRVIDTARFYENEAEVGAAVRASDQTIFVTTKLWRDDMGEGRTRAAFDRSMEQLGLDWLDLYLIHWPEPQTGLAVDTWKEMVALRDEGRVRSIGVSNFTQAHLTEIIDATGVVPAVNQVEMHPRFQKRALRRFHEQHNIVTTAWSPLGRGTVLDDPAVRRVADKHGCTPGQAILAWHLAEGVSVIPKSSSRSRLAENLESARISLDDEDRAAFAAMDHPEGRIGPDPDDVGAYQGIPERWR